jgi:hypothetical protein
MLALFSILAHALAAPTAAMDPRYAPLLSWLDSCGATIGPVRLGKSAVGAGAGAFATEALDENALLFSVPETACVTLYDACGDADVGDSLARLTATGQGGATVALAGIIAKEWLCEGANGPRGPYLAMLPWNAAWPPEGEQEQEHVLWWSEAQVDRRRSPLASTSPPLHTPNSAVHKLVVVSRHTEGLSRNIIPFMPKDEEDTNVDRFLRFSVTKNAPWWSALFRALHQASPHRGRKASPSPSLRLSHSITSAHRLYGPPLEAQQPPRQLDLRQQPPRSRHFRSSLRGHSRMAAAVVAAAVELAPTSPVQTAIPLCSSA